MKKKIASLALVLALCLSLLPLTAFAEEGGTKSSITVCSDTWTDTTYAKTNAGAVSKDGATDTDYNIYWDASTSTLTLNNATIQLTSTETLTSVISANIDVLNIILIGTNSIEVTNGQNAAFTAIFNTGTINITSGSEETGSISIKVTQTVDINNNDIIGIYTETGLTNSANVAIDIQALSSITIKYKGDMYGIKAGRKKRK